VIGTEDLFHVLQHEESPTSVRSIEVNICGMIYSFCASVEHLVCVCCHSDVWCSRWGHIWQIIWPGSCHQSKLLWFCLVTQSICYSLPLNI